MNIQAPAQAIPVGGPVPKPQSGPSQPTPVVTTQFVSNASSPISELRDQAALRIFAVVISAQAGNNKTLPSVAAEYAWRCADEFMKAREIKRNPVTYQTGVVAQPVAPVIPQPPPNLATEITELPPNVVPGLNVFGAPLEEVAPLAEVKK